WLNPGAVRGIPAAMFEEGGGAACRLPSAPAGPCPGPAPPSGRPRPPPPRTLGERAQHLLGAAEVHALVGHRLAAHQTGRPRLDVEALRPAYQVRLEHEARDRCAVDGD